MEARSLETGRDAGVQNLTKFSSSLTRLEI